MNPLLEIPVLIPEKDGTESVLTGRIQPGEIAYYYPIPGAAIGTEVVLKCGVFLRTAWTPEQLDHARIAYYDFIKANPSSKHNIRMEPVQKPKSDA